MQCQPTLRFGTQVGLSPLLSRSMSSALSLVSTGAATLSVTVSGSGDAGFESSGTGPSQNSVRMLSSDVRRSSMGARGSGTSAGFFVLVGPSHGRSGSWNIGMVEVWSCEAGHLVRRKVRLEGSREEVALNRCRLLR